MMQITPYQLMDSSTPIRYKVTSAPTISSGANLTAAVSAIGPENERSPWLASLPWAAAFLFLTGCVVLGVMYIRRPVPDERPVSFVIPPPDMASNVSAPNISPDGRTIAFVMTVDGKSGIYVRELGSLTEQRLNGTDDTTSLFWSPDSRTIAFIANDKLKKVDVGGGPVQVICNAPKAFSGAWSRDGVILFGGSENGIRRVFCRTDATLFIRATIAPLIHRKYLSPRSTEKSENSYSRVRLTFTTLRRDI